MIGIGTEQEPIVIREGEYKPYYKFGLLKLAKIVEKLEGTREDPIFFQMEDPIFGRILRLINDEKGVCNVGITDVGGFDEIFRGKVIKVDCLGARKEISRGFARGSFI